MLSPMSFSETTEQVAEQYFQLIEYLIKYSFCKDFQHQWKYADWSIAQLVPLPPFLKTGVTSANFRVSEN